MSTRATIWYDDQIHIFHELIDDTVRVDAGDADCDVVVRLMTFDEWKKMVIDLAPKYPREDTTP